MAENISRMLREETSYQKSVARGDRHRKKGGGRKCTLGVDNMSNSQINKMNGPVITYDGRVGTFEDFMQMGASEKIEFLDRMQYLYEVNQHTLSQIWGVQYSMLNGYLNNVGLKMRPAYPNKAQKEAIAQMIDNRKNGDNTLEFSVRAIGYTEFENMKMQDRTAYVQQVCNAFEISITAVYMTIFNAKSLKSASNIVKVFPVDKNVIDTVVVNNSDNMDKFVAWYKENAPEIHPPYTRYESLRRTNKTKKPKNVEASKEVATTDLKISGEITLEGSRISDIIEQLQKLQQISDTAEIIVCAKL